MPQPAPAPRRSAPAPEHPDISAPARLVNAEHERVLAEVRRTLAALKYGSVTLVVQDGRIIQVDTTSKMRLVSSATR